MSPAQVRGFDPAPVVALRALERMEVDESWEPLSYPLYMFPKFEVEDEPILLGIDETGRGPTLGPMVYCAAFCKLSEKAVLAKAGYMGMLHVFLCLSPFSVPIDQCLTAESCIDSKELKGPKREALFEALRAAKALSVGYVTRVLNADELSGQMLDLYVCITPKL